MKIGISKWDIETPALLIDLGLMEENIGGISKYFSKRKSDLRAHIKTHKSPAIAHKQIQSGSVGICCQKLGEAEVMVENGIKDILITSEVVDPEKIEKLVCLNKHSETKVVVDNLKVAKAISEAARIKRVKQGIVVELEIGIERCGIAPGKPALNFVKEITKMSGLKFCGLMGYEGPFFGIRDFEQRKSAAHSRLALLRDTAIIVEDAGIDVEIVSAGSTGTYNITGEYDMITEVEAGSYIFMDSTYKKLENLDFNCSLTVLATIISRSVPERAVTNAGLKALSFDFGRPELLMEDMEVAGLSEEHGKIRTSLDNNIKVGDKIEIIPSHCCTTVNLHNYYYGIRDDKVEVVWPITARGKFH